MRHRKHTFKVGRKPAHTRAMLANLACSAIMEGQIKTTVAKGKELRRLVDRMVTLAKSGTLHDRRRAVSIIKQRSVVKYLFDELAPKFADRPGGYTRVLRLGTRLGDAAEMGLFQLVTEPLSASSAAATTTTDAAEAATEEAVVEALVGEAEEEVETA